jgi:hypothetical protein
MSPEQRVVVDYVESWVRDRLDAAVGCAHGWHQTGRVQRNIVVLAQSEAVNPLLAELSALLRDVGRTEPGTEEEHGARSAAMAEPLLSGFRLPVQDQQGIVHAVRWPNSRRRDTPLLCILREADMLGGLGAMRPMRAFMSKSHLPPYNHDTPFDPGTRRKPPSSASDQALLQVEWYDLPNTTTARHRAQVPDRTWRSMEDLWLDCTSIKARSS